MRRAQQGFILISVLITLSIVSGLAIAAMSSLLFEQQTLSLHWHAVKVEQTLKDFLKDKIRSVTVESLTRCQQPLMSNAALAGKGSAWWAQSCLERTAVGGIRYFSEKLPSKQGGSFWRLNAHLDGGAEVHRMWFKCGADPCGQGDGVVHLQAYLVIRN
jgi:type II secretory pathway pseudopilin PulG